MKEQHALRALIVDDEKALRRFLKTALSSHGYQVFEAGNGLEALEESVSCHPDVIIIDLGLPDKDGIEVTREIRRRTKTPIIILSVRDREEDKIQALDAGADDYLTKPFSAGELMARLRAVIRRLVPQNETTFFKAGKLAIDIGKHTVELNGRALQLSPTEFDIVKVLVMNAGKVVTQKQILKEVWNKTEEMEGASHLLRVTISNLRNKIEPNPDRPTYLLTEPGVGYRLHTED
ncbi:MAG TPA: response regulator transcription factor [Verrucomicrobiae bacterium]|jgi:two-component system KDP operon response regulator KdpE|nr:response regulator transcription factor [Verrucomicrobiae bacterium]